MGRYAEAEGHLRRAVGLFSEDVESRLALARVLYARGRFNQYTELTRATLQYSENNRYELPQVRAFLEAFENGRAGKSLPPAPHVGFITARGLE